MKRMTSVLIMQARDRLSWLYLPWLILFSSFFVNVIIGVFMGGKTEFYTGGLSSIFIYMFVAGIVNLSQTFPFALGLSIRRTDFFVGTSMMYVVISAVSALLLLIFSLVESKLTGGWGVNLHFFNFPYMNDGSVIVQLAIYFILFVHMFFLGLVISSIYRRFGMGGIFIFFTALFLVIGFGTYALTYYEKWGDIFIWITQHTAFELSLWIVPAIIVYILASYGLLRKATI